MSGECKRGELNIWTKTKAFNIFKQFTGVDDLWCYSEIFIMCPLNFMKCGQAHKPGDTSWHKNSDWRLIKEKKKEESFLFGCVTNRAGPREDELNSAPATAHFSSGQELCVLAIMGFFYLQKKWKRICGLTDVPVWPFSLENLSSNITEYWKALKKIRPLW